MLNLSDRLRKHSHDCSCCSAIIIIVVLTIVHFDISNSQLCIVSAAVVISWILLGQQLGSYVPSKKAKKCVRFLWCLLQIRMWAMDKLNLLMQMPRSCLWPVYLAQLCIDNILFRILSHRNQKFRSAFRESFTFVYASIHWWNNLQLWQNGYKNK